MYLFLCDGDRPLHSREIGISLEDLLVIGCLSLWLDDANNVYVGGLLSARFNGLSVVFGDGGDDKGRVVGYWRWWGPSQRRPG